MIITQNKIAHVRSYIRTYVPWIFLNLPAACSVSLRALVVRIVSKHGNRRNDGNGGIIGKDEITVIGEITVMNEITEMG